MTMTRKIAWSHGRYEFGVYHRGTNLRANPTIWADTEAQAKTALRRQEGFTAKAFEVRLLSTESEG
jgi:hypothetical protein